MGKISQVLSPSLVVYILSPQVVSEKENPQKQKTYKFLNVCEGELGFSMYVTFVGFVFRWDHEDPVVLFPSRWEWIRVPITPLPGSHVRLFLLCMYIELEEHKSSCWEQKTNPQKSLKSSHTEPTKTTNIKQPKFLYVFGFRRFRVSLCLRFLLGFVFCFELENNKSSRCERKTKPPETENL